MLPHIAAYDGLRGVAVILVCLYHIFYLNGGHIGVDIFFVLSGFLITGKFIEEFAATGRIDVGRFFIRRALRLMPALWVMVAGYLFLSWLVHPPAQFQAEQPLAWMALLYVTNFYWIVQNDLVYDPFGHTWSLGVEEQFYILAGLAIGPFLRRTAPETACRWLAAIAILSLAWGWLLHLTGASDVRIACGPDTRAYELFAGAAAAAWIRTGDHAARFLRLHLKSRQTGILALALLIGLGMLANQQASFALIFLARPLACVATLILLLLAFAGTGDRAIGILDMRWLGWIGRISYGVYLWNDALYWLVNDRSAAIRLLVAGGGAVLLAALSHRFVEQPFLALKARFIIRTTQLV